MSLTDNEFLSSIINSFELLPNLINSDAAIAISDLESFLTFKQANTFKIDIKVGMNIAKGGTSEQAIKTKTKQVSKCPKEVFGFPIIDCAIPISNSYTGNVVGTITYGISLEKESKVIDMSNELSSYSEELTASSEELASSTQELSSNSFKLNDFMNNTQTALIKMDDVIKYIKGLADTTNMLGLNAAIEAARAGENGRGFSVVADEIRKLAASSKDSTAKINETLKNVKEDINQAIERINQFSEICSNQAGQAEEIASSSQRLSQFSSELLKVAEDLY